MTQETPVFLKEYLDLHAADLADRLQRLDIEEARELLRQLPPEKAAAALAEVDRERLAGLLEGFDAHQLSGLLSSLPPEDAADLLQEVSAGTRREVLAELSPESAEGLRALMQYPEDTVGGVMSNRFIALRTDMTVEEALQVLRAQAREEYPEDITYLYVTDAARRLVGIVSLRDLVFRRSDRRIAEIMNPDVKFVRAETDREELARLFEHYHYLGLPVVDAEGRLVGVVKASDVLEVVSREATEDMQLMVGLSGEERALSPWFYSVKRRLPWLYINLATAFLAAFVVGLFEDTIARWTTLAIFLPVIAGQGGNAGMQNADRDHSRSRSG